jgi:ketosteroid isomerase-like protein
LDRGDRHALYAPFEEGLIAAGSTATPLPDVPGAGGRTFVGYEGLREFVRAWTEDWAGWKIVLEETIDAGDDRVVAVVHQSAIGKSSGTPVSLRFAMVFTLKSGQVVDRRDYRTRAEALEAVGLSQ